MKKLLLAVFLPLSLNISAQIYSSKVCILSFFSATVMENIDATNKDAHVLLNTSNNNIAVKASQTLFIFKSAFMQEHYNENYMESEKYPLTTFSGKINEPIDYSTNGKYDVTVTGILNMHGVDQSRTINGTIEVQDGKIILDSKFDVKVADHKIKVPSLYVEKIAEVIQVTFHSELEPYKK
jgi:hypothetical protein